MEIDEMANTPYTMFMLNANQIRAIRKKLGLSQTAFSQRLGVTQNTVARWEIGDRHPKWDMMEKICGLAEEAGMDAAALAAAK